MSGFQLDGHKLHYHPGRVADYLEGREVWPLYAEISPTSRCNHRCLFCNFNYLGHRGHELPPGRLLTLIDELWASGVNAVVLAGAGEPTLHPDSLPALRRGRERGLDLALSTNGARLTDEDLADLAENLTWVRFSMAGGTPETYARVHRAGPEEFGRVLGRLEKLRERREKTGSRMTIGVQMVLVDANQDDPGRLADAVKKRGADYLVIKHFYDHEDNAYRPDLAFRDGEYLRRLTDLAAERSGPNFAFIVRPTETLDRRRPYHDCPGLPFIVYIRETGDLFSCFSHQDDPATAVGSLLTADFATLWQSPGREAAFRRLREGYDKDRCQANCRHHQINLWLDALRRPPAHVNFI